jgi:hypothetical protein
MNRVQPTQAPRTQKNRRQRVTIAAVQERKKKKKKKKKKVYRSSLAADLWQSPALSVLGLHLLAFLLAFLTFPPRKVTYSRCMLKVKTDYFLISFIAHSVFWHLRLTRQPSPTETHTCERCSKNATAASRQRSTTFSSLALCGTTMSHSIMKINNYFTEIRMQPGATPAE